MKKIKKNFIIDDHNQKYGFTHNSTYKWKTNYNDTDFSSLKEIRALNEENRCIKRVQSELSLVHEAFTGIFQKMKSLILSKIHGLCHAKIQIKHESGALDIESNPTVITIAWSFQ